MRHSMRALLGVMLVGWCCCQALAAESESGSGFWLFGKKQEIKVAQPSSAASDSVSPDAAATDQQKSFQQYPKTPEPEYATTPDPERRWMVESPLAKVSWPRIHMPTLPKPKLPPSPFPTRSEVDAARNSWVEKSPDSAQPSPLQAVKNGASRVGKSTRNAWDKTVDVLTPGEREKPQSSRVARSDNRPFWKRMLFVEPTQPQGAQTITEWMAQDRLDP